MSSILQQAYQNDDAKTIWLKYQQGTYWGKLFQQMLKYKADVSLLYFYQQKPELFTPTQLNEIPQNGFSLFREHMDINECCNRWSQQEEYSNREYLRSWTQFVLKLVLKYQKEIASDPLKDLIARTQQHKLLADTSLRLLGIAIEKNYTDIWDLYTNTVSSDHLRNLIVESVGKQHFEFPVWFLQNKSWKDNKQLWRVLIWKTRTHKTEFTPLFKELIEKSIGFDAFYQMLMVWGNTDSKQSPFHPPWWDEWCSERKIPEQYPHLSAIFSLYEDENEQLDRLENFLKYQQTPLYSIDEEISLF